MSQRLNAQTNQTITSGSATAAVTFPGAGCVYNWVNDNPSIGLRASGTGNIPSFAAINNSGSTVVATIVATPALSGFAYISNTNSNTLSVIDISSNTVVATIPVGIQPIGVSVSADGTHVYVANSGSGTVSVINTSLNSVIATVRVGSYPYGVAASPNGKFVYATNFNDGTLTVINMATNLVAATVPAGSQPLCVAVSPDGGHIYVTNNNFTPTDKVGSITAIDGLTNTIVATINLSAGAQPWGITVSPDGSRVYAVNNHANTVSVINAANNTVVTDIVVGEAPQGVVISPDGKRAYVTDGASDNVSVINTATNSVGSIIASASGPIGVSMSVDGSRLYIVNDFSGTVSVINTATNAKVATINVGLGPNTMGNFVTGTGVCQPVSFTITVNPGPVSLPTIAVTTSTATISACAGTASSSPNIRQFTVSGSSLTGDIMATAPPSFEISSAPGSGYGNSLTLTPSAGSVPNTVIYVRSSASAPAGNISGNVVLTSAGAADQRVAVSGTINALPTIALVSNQTFANGTVTTGVAFLGTATTFSWVNDTPAIGLAANGTGNIAPFNAVNTGSKPLTATITATPLSAGFAYITNEGNSVSVINTITGSIVSTIPVGSNPIGVAVSRDGSRVYVTNMLSNDVSVINAVTNTVITTVSAGTNPLGVAVTPDGTRIYVANSISNTVSVISAATNTVIASIPVGLFPIGIAISPDGSQVYVTNANSNSISVINTGTGVVTATIAVGSEPYGISISADGARAYVSNSRSNTVSVINTATNLVTATIAVGTYPTGISVTPDGSQVYVANLKSNTVSVINTLTNTAISTIAAASPLGVSLSADGSRAYVTNESSGNILVINTANQAVITAFGAGRVPQSFGNFISNGSGCSGDPTSFTITINASPTSPLVSAGILSGSISACAGTASSAPDILKFTASGNNLTGDITASAPASFEVSLTPGSGYGNNVIITAPGATVNNITVYVRSAASAPAGNISGSIVLSSPGATSQNIAVTATINPLPVINAVADQTVNDGAATKQVNFSGTATTISWVNDKPAIGLPASGTANILPFKAVNIGSSPLTATISAVGTGGTGCIGLPVTFTITVIPPGANNLANNIVVPNTFTPNGDGVNDTWNIKNLDTFPNCTVEVYNRYGEKVYSSIGYGLPWDGKCGGVKLTFSTYYYMIDLRNGDKTLSGSITIIR